MHTFMASLIAASTACTLAHAAAAGTVYKCSVGGKVSYGDQPCANGGGTQLALAPAPVVDPAAAEKSANDMRRLQALEKARIGSAAREDRLLQRERERVAKAMAAQRQKCERLRLKAKWQEEDAGRARGAAVAGARLKAKRQAEALAVECPA